MSKHIDYFDLLRGMAIIFVIICHSYSGNPLGGGIKEELYLLVRQLVTCAVPLFLAESGFFLSNKVLDNKKEYIRFLGRHSFRIWLPMVVWSIPMFFIKEHQNAVLSILFMMFGGYSIYYFITLIIQYYAMQPILKKINLGGVFVCFSITAVSLAADNYYTSIQGHHLPLLIECGPFVMWLAYPAVGYYLGKKGRDYKIWPWLTVMIISLVACIIESKWLYAFHGEGLGATKISALFFSFSTIMVMFGERTQEIVNTNGMANRVLVYIGEISFGIYLVHKYFLDYLIGPLINDTFLRAALTLLLSVVFIAIVKKLLPKSVSQLIGFR